VRRNNGVSKEWKSRDWPVPPGGQLHLGEGGNASGLCKWRGEKESKFHIFLVEGGKSGVGAENRRPRLIRDRCSFQGWDQKRTENYNWDFHGRKGGEDGERDPGTKQFQLYLQRK